MATTAPYSTATSAPDGAWRSASRRELVVLAGYFLGVIALTDALNIRPGAEILTAMVAVAAVCISGAGRQFAHDWWVFVLGLFLWRFSGAVAGQSPFSAHVDILIHADRVLGLGHDPVVLVHQAFANPAHLQPLDWIMAAVYNLHLPEPYIAGYFLWRLDRAVYQQYAASVLLLLVLGFATFVLFPTMPPWMASTWYHRIPGIVNGFGRVLHAHPRHLIGEPIFYVWRLGGDQIAAVPSEHAAFPMLELLAFTRVLRRAALVLVPWVLVVLFAVVYLGMHWLIDPLVGWAYAIAIFWFVRWFARRPRVVHRS